jgi:hypothetical protein
MSAAVASKSSNGKPSEQVSRQMETHVIRLLEDIHEDWIPRLMMGDQSGTECDDRWVDGALKQLRTFLELIQSQSDLLSSSPAEDNETMNKPRHRQQQLISQWQDVRDALEPAVESWLQDHSQTPLDSVLGLLEQLALVLGGLRYLHHRQTSQQVS